MSVPLLLERTMPGMGPKVPLKDVYDVLVVEGLAGGCEVMVDVGDRKHRFAGNIRTSIPTTVKGLVAQAELAGLGSKVHVWLEKSNAR